jgi:hypothetical protein
MLNISDKAGASNYLNLSPIKHCTRISMGIMYKKGQKSHPPRKKYPCMVIADLRRPSATY